MILSVCIDDKGGMAFNHRRQSRDRAQQEDLLQLCGGGLWIAPYSAPLFDWAAEQVRVSEDFLKQAGAGEYCFAEDRPLASVVGQMEALVLYRWNRRYPSDLKFDLDLSAFQLTEAIEFPGNSHETITREIYQRKESTHG